MQYGLVLPLAGIDGDVQRLAEYGQQAEESGWDGVFLEDYIVFGDDGPVFDPWLALTAIALRTTRLRLGVSITPLPRRRPWKLAREAVTLDHLSNGRLILGFAIGDGRDRSFAHFGEETDARRRAEMLDEGLEILTGLWSGRPFSYHGAHYQVQEITFLPRPVQTPRIPIWIGGFWPRKGPVRRAARWDGMASAKVNPDGAFGEMTPDDVRALKAEIMRQRTSDAPFDIIVAGQTTPDNPIDETVRAMDEAGATWWVELFDGPADAFLSRIKQGPPRLA